MKNKILILSSIIFVLSFLNIQAEEKDMDFDVKAMSLEEKAYQVIMIGIPLTHASSYKDITSYISKEFEAGIPGSIILFKHNIYSSAQESAKYIKCIKDAFIILAKKSRWVSIAPIIAIDNEGGSVFRTSKITTSLPSAMTIANSMNSKQAEELYYILGKQMKMLGIDFNLAPVVECTTHQNRLFLKDRTFSSDCDVTVEFSNAFIKGMNRAGLLACIKHFPGHGEVDTHVDPFSLFCTKEVLESVYISPFKRILQENHPSLSILLSHTSFPIIEDIPFSLSKKGINELVRKELNFKSLLLSDDICMGALKKGLNLSDNAILALEAGVDMIISSKGKISEIATAIVERARRDVAFASRLDEAVLNVLRVKKASIEMNVNKNNSINFDKNKFNELKIEGDKIIKKLQDKPINIDL
jgi:glycosyl hydrolase, family 3